MTVVPRDAHRYEKAPGSTWPLAITSINSAAAWAHMQMRHSRIACHAVCCQQLVRRRSEYPTLWSRKLVRVWQILLDDREIANSSGAQISGVAQAMHGQSKAEGRNSLHELKVGKSKCHVVRTSSLRNSGALKHIYIGYAPLPRRSS